MKKTFLSPDGTTTRELSIEEIKKYALDGDSEAKKELLRQNWAMLTTEEKLEKIKELLLI